MSEEEKYYLYDIESGTRYQVSQEAHEAYIRCWEAFRPKLTNRNIGIPIIFGTGGDLDGEHDYKNIFYESL